MSDRQAAAWLRLTLTPGVGGETQRQLLKAFGDPEAIFSAAPSALRAAVGGAVGMGVISRLLQGTLDTGAEDERSVDAAIAIGLAWAAQPGNHLLTLADATYPQALLSMPDPPTVLYAKGDIALLNRPALAVVGSRNATKQGENNATAFTEALSAAGLVIVSGLAAGIDAAAHRGALAGPASTIAVIGTGIDRIYPARNAALAREIAERGVLLSEFPLGTPPIANNFPRRNRLIAGLARGCLVVEAAKQSGSLITARLAAEAGREVFAIPGSIHSPQSKGCHALIKQGAKLVEAAQDVLEELRWERIVNPATAATMAAVPEAETDPLLLALGRDPCDLDTLAERSGLSADNLLAQLLPLELDGRVAQLPGGRYQRLN